MTNLFEVSVQPNWEERGFYFPTMGFMIYQTLSLFNNMLNVKICFFQEGVQITESCLINII